MSGVWAGWKIKCICVISGHAMVQDVSCEKRVETRSIACMPQAARLGFLRRTPLNLRMDLVSCSVSEQAVPQRVLAMGGRLHGVLGRTPALRSSRRTQHTRSGLGKCVVLQLLRLDRLREILPPKLVSALQNDALATKPSSVNLW